MILCVCDVDVDVHPYEHESLLSTMCFEFQQKCVILLKEVFAVLTKLYTPLKCGKLNLNTCLASNLHLNYSYGLFC